MAIPIDKERDSIPGLRQWAKRKDLAVMYFRPSDGAPSLFIDCYSQYSFHVIEFKREGRLVHAVGSDTRRAALDLAVDFVVWYQPDKDPKAYPYHA